MTCLVQNALQVLCHLRRSGTPENVPATSRSSGSPNCSRTSWLWTTWRNLSWWLSAVSWSSSPSGPTTSSASSSSWSWGPSVQMTRYEPCSSLHASDLIQPRTVRSSVCALWIPSWSRMKAWRVWTWTRCRRPVAPEGWGLSGSQRIDWESNSSR